MNLLTAEQNPGLEIASEFSQQITETGYHFSETVPVAWQIITTEHGDYYLQKLAAELLFELMANAVTQFVDQNRAGLQNDRSLQYANIIHILRRLYGNGFFCIRPSSDLSADSCFPHSSLWQCLNLSAGKLIPQFFAYSLDNHSVRGYKITYWDLD